MSYEERCALNYDHPSAFDTELFLQHLQALKNGESIACPVYDFKEHDRSNETLLISPAPIVVLEGIFAVNRPAHSLFFRRKDFCGYGCRCACFAPCGARCQPARAQHGKRDCTVSDNGKSRCTNNLLSRASATPMSLCRGAEKMPSRWICWFAA